MSVVICAYTEERMGDLIDAVASVGLQTVPPRETVVVIDHNDPLLRRATRALPEALVVPNEEQQGLSGGRNTGARWCTADVVAFLDDDAVADPDWLERLGEGYEDDNVLATGGAIRPVWSTGRRAFFPDEFAWVVGCTYRGLPPQRADVRNLIGANMSFRREVIDAIGGFRSESGRTGARPFGNDDTEFCIRLSQAYSAGRIIYVPEAGIGHKVPPARSTWSYFVSRCFIEGLSKAQLTDFVGAGKGLASERRHALRVLPRGVARGAADAVRRRDASGLARSAAIVVGLATTTIGYLVGRSSARRRAPI